MGWNISLQEFAKFLNKEKKVGKYEWRKKAGKLGTVFIYEVPSNPHEAAAGELHGLFFNLPAVRARASPTMSIGGVGGVPREPDTCIFPRGVPKPAANPCDTLGNPWPTVLVEVQFIVISLPMQVGWDETVADLHADALTWLGAGTTIQIVVIVKLWPRRSNGTAAMLAMSFTRGVANPTAAISFGTAAIANHHVTTAQVIAIH